LILSLNLNAIPPSDCRHSPLATNPLLLHVIPNTFPLQHLAAGQAGCIRRLIGLPDDVRRLEEFGLRPGARVEMFRPGNPCIVRLGGSKVCLRANDLLHILVEPISKPAPPRGRRRRRWRGGTG
jgi:Fe2+ transport system protein FeoA